MSDFTFSEHATDMLNERKIREAWVDLAINDPDAKRENSADGTIHYIKSIKEYNDRHLRVVVNPSNKPIKIVTLFFDRRLGKKNET